MTTKKVLFAVTSHSELGDTGRATGFYAPEVAHPAAVFQEAGYGIDFVSVAGGQPPVDGVKPDDEVTQRFLADAAVKAQLASTKTATELTAADYDVIYFAGGHGTMWDFPDAKPLADLAAQIYDQGGVVAAVCHGPAGLLGITTADGSPLVSGKRVSSFTNEEETSVGLADTVPFLLESALIERGGRHEKGAPFAEFGVTDNRLITGQNPASAAHVARMVIDEQRS